MCRRGHPPPGRARAEGGAGGNAVNTMIAAGLQGVEFIVANTDAQALTMSRAKGIIQMGTQVTGGLGAGS